MPLARFRFEAVVKNVAPRFMAQQDAPPPKPSLPNSDASCFGNQIHVVENIVKVSRDDCCITFIVQTQVQRMLAMWRGHDCNVSVCTIFLRKSDCVSRICCNQVGSAGAKSRDTVQSVVDDCPDLFCPPFLDSVESADMYSRVMPWNES